jgi:hypothetical protein
LTFSQVFNKIDWLFLWIELKALKGRGWIFEKASRRDWSWGRIANWNRKGKFLEKAA